MRKVHMRMADLYTELTKAQTLGPQTDGNTCAGPGAAAIQEDLITNSHSINTGEKRQARTYRQSNPSWKWIDQNSLNVLQGQRVKTGEGIEGGWGNTHIIQNVIFNLDRPIFIQGGLDVTWPNYCTRGVRDFGIARISCGLTFVMPIDFLLMVFRSLNLGAMPRDYPKTTSVRRCSLGIWIQEATYNKTPGGLQTERL